MIEITNVHMVGGTQHEHIAELKWKNTSDGKTGATSRADLVAWLEPGSGNRAIVRDGQGCVDVGIVRATPPYVRTHADGRWTDNLLALPRY